MRRTYTALTCVLAGAASLSAVASAHGGAASAHVGRAASVDLRHTSLGSILTSASGFTLYEFTRDHGAHDSCVKIGGCSTAWPALETSGTPTAGPGVRASLLSTIRLSGGVKQITYAGHPLYRYSGDSRPGSTSYVGVQAFGGSWYALSASGGPVK
jgi:predicted lipoprotein with Yx(FWY)xxD motif